MQHEYPGVGVTHVPGGTGLYHCCGACIGVQFKKLQVFFFLFLKISGVLNLLSSYSGLLWVAETMQGKTVKGGRCV